MELSKYKKVVVYGAGNAGRTAVGKIVSSYSNIQLECVVVTSCTNNPYHVYGKEVVSVDELKERLVYNQSEYAILIAVMGDCQEEIKKTLMKYGFINIYHMTDQMYTEWQKEEQEHGGWQSRYLTYYRRYMEPCLNSAIEICEDYHIGNSETRKHIRQLCVHSLYSDKYIMARLVVVLGTKCSLRCKECNNLMPHFSPQGDLNLECILTSLKKVLEKTEMILRCELIGGEPFLSKNMEKTLQFLIESNRIGQIEITTNGKTMPDNTVIPLLKNKKVKVRISDYGSLVDKEKMIEVLEANSIRYQILELGSWISPGGVEKRFRNIIQLKEYYSACPSGYYCKTLYEDKIFACARAASLYALNYMKENEFVLVDEGMTTKELKDFIMKDYSEACDYCDINSENASLTKPAEQL